MLSVLKLKCKIGLRYRKYLFWQCCTNIISGTESVIATHSMFDALSIGKTETDVCSLTFNLMGKEIIGQIFGIPIINKMSIELTCDNCNKSFKNRNSFTRTTRL